MNAIPALLLKKEETPYNLEQEEVSVKSKVAPNKSGAKAVKSKTVKAYKLKVDKFINKGKLRRLEELAQEWTRVSQEAFDWAWVDFLNPEIGQFNFSKSRSGPSSIFPKTTLVTSQKDLIAVAIQGQAKSWMGNLKNRGTLLIGRHHAKLVDRLRCDEQAANESLKEDLARLEQFRHELNWINSMKLWNVPFHKQCQLLEEAKSAKKTSLTSLSLRASVLMRRWLRQYLVHFKKPDPSYLPLQANSLSCVFSKNKKSKKCARGYWLRLSTLSGRINIPLMGHSKFDSDLNTCNLTFSLICRKEEWFVIATKNQAEPGQSAKVKSSVKASPTKVIGLDMGVKNFIATSKGDIHGRNRLNKLKNLDEKIQQCQKGLQNAGVLEYGQTKRYQKLIQEAKHEVTSTVRTCLKSVVVVHQPDVVVIEQLKNLARDAQMGRQLNRIIRNFGQAAFDQELNKLSKSKGFSVAKVPAAFTSQTCKACNFCLGTNRKGNLFKCMACGYARHADVQAATNLEKRFSHESDDSLKSANDPLVRATYQLRTLVAWVERQLARLTDPDSSGSVREHRALGSSKAGLKALLRTKRFRSLDVFKGLSQSNIDDLSKKELISLLIGTQNKLNRSIELNRVSTR